MRTFSFSSHGNDLTGLGHGALVRHGAHVNVIKSASVQSVQFKRITRRLIVRRIDHRCVGHFQPDGLFLFPIVEHIIYSQKIETISPIGVQCRCVTIRVIGEIECFCSHLSKTEFSLDSTAQSKGVAGGSVPGPLKGETVNYRLKRKPTRSHYHWPQ